MFWYQRLYKSSGPTWMNFPCPYNNSHHWVEIQHNLSTTILYYRDEWSTEQSDASRPLVKNSIWSWYEKLLLSSWKWVSRKRQSISVLIRTQGEFIVDRFKSDGEKFVFCSSKIISPFFVRLWIFSTPEFPWNFTKAMFMVFPITNRAEWSIDTPLNDCPTAS